DTGECAAIAGEIAVVNKSPPPPNGSPTMIWPLRNSWNRATENLYSAWLEKLFDDPLDTQPSWPALHEVLRDQKRNFLFNYLGANEDQIKMVLRPDCADTPYFLRAYFASKMGLPSGSSRCTRGGGGRGPHCPAWFSIANPEPPRAPPEAAAPPVAATGGFWNRTPEPAAAPPPAPVRRHLGLVGSFG